MIHNFWPKETRTLPTTIDVIDKWEEQWKLKLPKLLKELYLIHNGTIDSIGELDNMYAVDSDYFTPSQLKEDVSDLENSLSKFEDYKEDLENLKQDFKNLDLITPFASYGSYIVCLDWNRTGRDNEPEVGLFSWSIENEVWYQIKEKTFEEYTKKLKS